MMVQMDEGLWNALLELDTLMQEKKSLVSQLEELTLSRYDYPDKLLNYHLSVVLSYQNMYCLCVYVNRISHFRYSTE